MEHVGDLEMEVYDATEGKCPRIFYPNTWDQTNLEKRDSLNWDLDSLLESFGDHDESFAY